MTAACDLCGAPDGQPLYGLSICETCQHAELGERATETWGPVISVEHSKEYDPHQLYEDAFLHHVTISIDVEEAVPVAAHFEPEKVKHRLVKLFKEELQAGDARFDDAIYIVDDHRHATEQLLHIEGAREAILVLVEGGGRLELTPGHLELRREQRGRTDLSMFVCAARALARHLHDLEPDGQ